MEGNAEEWKREWTAEGRTAAAVGGGRCHAVVLRYTEI